MEVQELDCLEAIDIKNLMEGLEHPALEGLEVKNLHSKQLDLESTCPLTQRTTPQYHSQRALLRLYLNTHVLEECLQSFNIFKDVLEDPLQKKKLVRDVMRNIRLQTVAPGVSLYSKGDLAESIFMVLKGAVALCLPVAREDLLETSHTVQYDFKEIDCFETGSGFGEGEFIQASRRGLAALGKEEGTVVGVLGAAAFEEVVESYRQRVYLGKLQMFGHCPLLQSLKPHQLEFVVNNAKPVHFPISHSIVFEGEHPKTLFLITQGKVELRTQSQNKPKIKLSRARNKQVCLEGDSLGGKQAVAGILEEGSFLGDSQLSLGTPFSFRAVCTSEKVKAYACNLKILQSQLGEDLSAAARSYYLEREEGRKHQLRCYTEAKTQVKREVESLRAVVLSLSQRKIKRQIMNRYVQKKPSLVDQLSPQEIARSIQRKYARFITLPPIERLSIPCPSKPPSLLKNHNALSPILKKQKRSQKGELRERRHSEGERGQEGTGGGQEGTGGGQEGGLSVVEMRRLYEFIGKVRQQVQHQH